MIPAIYQVRGFDLANISFIKSEMGWIVFDPLTSKETAKAALDFINEKLGERPVVAVVYSHSHADHFGGVRGVVDEADVKNGKVELIAPIGFIELRFWIHDPENGIGNVSSAVRMKIWDAFKANGILVSTKWQDEVEYQSVSVPSLFYPSLACKGRSRTVQHRRPRRSGYPIWWSFVEDLSWA